MEAYTKYAAYETSTITVTSSAELSAAVKALAANGGGTVKVDPAGGPYNLTLNGVGSSTSPVLIESMGTEKPQFESITITNSKYIAISGVDLDTSSLTNRASYVDDLRIENSSNIEVVDSSFTGSAVGYLSEATKGDVKGNTGAFVLKSENVLLDGNDFSNHWYAVKVVDTTDLRFTNNEVEQFQADGFHGGGLQDALIANNFFHNPLGSTQTLAHTDFIQIRRVDTGLQNKNIEIAYNLMDSEDGGAAQGIQAGVGGSDLYIDGLSIHDNVIHSALPRGIGVDRVLNLEIYNNTLLWDQASAIQETATSDWKSYDPRILVSGPEAKIYDNIASIIRVNGKEYSDGGYKIQYTNPDATNFVDNHIVNLDGSGDPVSYDLSIKESSPLYAKYGAAMSSVAATVEPDPVPEPVEPQDDVPDTDTGSDNGGATGAVRLYLIDSKTDEMVRELSSVDDVKPSELSSGLYNLEAVYEGGQVGSVQFWMGGVLLHTENGAPYAAYRDTKGDFWDQDLPEEGTTQEIEVRAYSDRDGTGTLLGMETFEIAFGREDDVDPEETTTPGETILGTSASESLIGGAGNDTINGREGNDQISGVGGDDELSGGAGRDNLRGGDGADVLDGGGGKDWLFGDAGNDVLDGGNGSDFLTGGDGSDLFVFVGKFGYDTITDFDAADNAERIDLRAIDGLYDWSGLESRMSQYQDMVKIDLGDAGTLTLQDVDIQNLDANDFMI